MSTNLAYAEPKVSPSDTEAQNDKFLERFGWMAGPEIDLSRRGGSSFVGQWPNDRMPARTLLRIPESTSLGPYEAPAVYMTGDAIEGNSPLIGIPAAPSSTPSALRPNQGSRVSRFTNNPKVCAYMLMRENEKRGMCLFETIKGLSWDEVKVIYSLVMPPLSVMVDEFGWDLEREVLGQRVRGPFLDQVREYLKPSGQAAERLKEMGTPGKRQNVTAERLRGAKDTLLEMRGAANRGWSYFIVRLNETESAVRRFRDGKPGKQDYDQPDERFINSMLPMDIQALANLNRTPIDLQQLAAGAKMTEDSNATMMKGFEMIANKMAANQPQAVTMEDVQKLLDERDLYWKTQLEEAGAAKEVVKQTPA